MAARPKKESLEESQGGDTDQPGFSVSDVSLHKNHLFLNLGLEHPIFLILCWEAKIDFIWLDHQSRAVGLPLPSYPSPLPPKLSLPNFPPNFLFIHLGPILSTLVSFIFSRLCLDLLFFCEDFVIYWTSKFPIQFCLSISVFWGKLSLFAPLIVGWTNALPLIIFSSSSPPPYHHHWGSLQTMLINLDLEFLAIQSI